MSKSEELYEAKKLEEMETLDEKYQTMKLVDVLQEALEALREINRAQKEVYKNGEKFLSGMNDKFDRIMKSHQKKESIDITDF